MRQKCECRSRRDFIKETLAAGAAIVVAPAVLRAQDGETVVAPSLKIDLETPENAPLKTVGGAVYVPDPGDSKRPIIVYRASETTVTAYSSKCTHKGGPLSLPNKDGVSICGWHHARFNTSGEVLKWPAKDNVKTFEALLADGIITIAL